MMSTMHKLVFGFVCIAMFYGGACMIHREVKVKLTEQAVVRMVTNKSRANGGHVISIHTVPYSAARSEVRWWEDKISMETSFPYRAIALTAVRDSDKIVFTINVAHGYVTEVYVDDKSEARFGDVIVSSLRAQLAGIPLLRKNTEMEPERARSR